MGEKMTCRLACETCIIAQEECYARERYPVRQEVSSTFGEPMKTQANNSGVNHVIVFKIIWQKR